MEKRFDVFVAKKTFKILKTFQYAAFNLSSRWKKCDMFPFLKFFRYLCSIMTKMKKR